MKSELQQEHPPVFFRDLALRLDKVNNGNNSPYTPESTLEKVQPFMHLAGVTRLAHITGLDRIGIPVYNAVRPNLRDFSVHHGKGVTPMAAKVSALMEAFERFYAAHLSLPSIKLSYKEISARYQTIPVDRLALCKFSLFNENLPFEWTWGWDLIRREEVAVPLANVALVDMARPWSMNSSHGILRGFFENTSNGLAADTTLLGAIYHALLEVIERDAITCSGARAQAAGEAYPLCRVQLDTIPFPVVQTLFEKIRRADILPVLFDCTVDTQVPTYNCFLLDLKDPHEVQAHGMGTSLDPEIAMTRAVTEAVQGRTVAKSGCRDTNFRDSYVKMYLENKTRRIANFSSSQGDLDLSGLQDQTTCSLEGDIHVCLERLMAVGVEQVIVLDIGPPDIELSVVKVIVPGLEGYLNAQYAYGVRGRQFLGEN